jgi:hypothetical protein
LCAALSAHAGTFTAFGPQKYTRATGAPVTVSNSFTILNPNTQYTLHVDNSGVSSAVISVNGTQILGPSDFNPNVASIDRAVTLNLNNEIDVQLRGQPGTSLTVSVIGVDNDPPVITASASPAADSFGWNNTNVVVTFVCSDKTSGVASCPAPVTVSSEGANQIVSGTATDRAGNTASTTVTINLDKTPPAIAAGAAPPANNFGWNNSQVTVTFNCTDSLSGVATCSPPVVVSSEGANQPVKGTATDKAGNSASATALVNIDETSPVVSATPVPAPNAAGWNNTGVTVTFTCSDSLSGVASCPAQSLVTTEGANQNVSGTAADKAGNKATASVSLNIDRTRPAIVASISPQPNGAGWNNSNVTVAFQCSDSLSGVATCPSPVTVTSEGGNQSVSGTAADVAGNTATTSASINLDKTPPAVSILSPAAGAVVNVSTITVSGAVSDSLSGVAGVSCNGAPAVLSGSSFSCVIGLVRGANTISAQATDVAGNTNSASTSVTFVTPVTITSPANLSLFNQSPVNVTGTVTDPAAQVSVNGISAPLSGNTFLATVPLQEGTDTITAVATNSDGTTSTASVQVILDTTPPHVAIYSPPDQFLTTDATITVTGMVNDIVVGTVNPQQATVNVNGIAADVSNRSFTAANVPLGVGQNVIQATAVDRAGNSANTSVVVIRQAAGIPVVKVFSGNGQSGSIGTALAQPLVAQLLDASGRPVTNTPVVFKVTAQDGTLASATASGQSSVITNTDGQGQASAQFTLGTHVGSGNNLVEASATGIQSTALFSASATSTGAALIVSDSGNDQRGATGNPLPLPFIAVVTDSGNNRIPNVPVTFTVTQGNGLVAGQAAFTVNSDSNGRVEAILTLGPDEGINNNVVEANFPGNPGFPVTFTASGQTPGPAAATTISGVVVDNSNQPIPGVTMRMFQLNNGPSGNLPQPVATPVQTDEQGQFLIQPAPVGAFKLMADGGTATRGGPWPTLEYDIVTVSGRNNTVGSPIYLPQLNPANQICVSDTIGGTLTMPQVPGFSLTIAAGSATFPGGSRTGCISVTPVNMDKVPMSPGFGQQPRFIVTIQPVGTMFNPPAAITLPNVDGLPPRAVTEMYSYDHDLASFVSIGSATVSADASVIKSDPGVGVLKAGWHCGGNPNPSGSAGRCADCQTCQGSRCVADPTQNNKVCSHGNNPVCTIDLCDPSNPGTCVHHAANPIPPFGPPDPFSTNDLSDMKPATQTAYSCLLQEVQSVGGVLTLKSAFRSVAYQLHLFEVWDEQTHLLPALLAQSIPQCTNVISNIQHEQARHGIAFKPCNPQTASIGCPHSCGIAFDAAPFLPSGQNIDTLAASCGLFRPLSADDQNHFQTLSGTCP